MLTIHSSIFDNPTFSYFRELHNKYGIVVSCYCYYYDDNTDFKLSDCTTKFQKEFQENSDWLKFGFHSKNGKSNYENTTSDVAKTDYNNVIKALYNITGDYGCIDRIVRLQNFAGNIDSVKAMRDSEHGIIGLLGPDDVRKSYYLSERESKTLYENDTLNDTANNIRFFNTDLRMESVPNIEKKLYSIRNKEYENKSKILVIFTHEWQLGKKSIKYNLEKCCKFAIDQGYHFSFLKNG